MKESGSDSDELDHLAAALSDSEEDVQSAANKANQTKKRGKRG